MSHLPKGYFIEDGRIKLDEKQSQIVQAIFTEYKEGTSLRQLALKYGFKTCHTQVKRILQNKQYLGDDVFPKIIEPRLFDEVNALIQKRAEQLGRQNKQTKQQVKTIPTEFVWQPKVKHYNDPYEEALYMYRLIVERR